nr:leucine-rich repeat-containing protein 56 isoform X2 [Nothobranchius furzeri]
MSIIHEPVGQKVRPTARVQVTELSESGNINPTPNPSKSDEGPTVELYLSPERLRELCGTHDLSVVTSLELCINTQENTLGNVGAFLPKLKQLKLNNSLILSVRDLGTTLSHLQGLWMSSCCLQDLDGISTFSSLQELYLAYNNLSDLSPISMLESLQLLDLEGNNVDDLVQVQYLGLCLKLQTLTLEGNPVCVRPNPTSSEVEDYSYRSAVRELVPQLRYLDDVRVEEDKLTCCSMTGEDWDILRNSIRECNSSEAVKDTADGVRPYTAHKSTRRPFSCPSGVRPLLSPSSRLTSDTRPRICTPVGSRPASSDFDLASVEVETSSLIDGAVFRAGKILFCGNPVKAVRARREKLKTAPTSSTLTPRDLPIHVPEHTYDLVEPNLGNRVNVFAELRAWREQHSRRLQIIEKERLPQILAIHHDTEDETDGGEEEEAFSPNLSGLSLAPNTRRSAASAAANRKLLGIRTRRLHLSQASSDFNRERCTPQTATAVPDTDLVFERVRDLEETHVPHRPCPPPVNALPRGPANSNVNLSGRHSGKHNISKPLNSPLIPRPHTARAVLQKPRQHHQLQPDRGRSHPD